ncbi:hypothetical protein SCLARK_00927 [Spiroplasma clarkii]|uniref:Uncharacterized protein n=1 Tax=Spiroplasma clarkii TaxID=2139 RepID=A0A1Y0L1C5_9MOLU|nr:hypothetical protein [Spiroplasma clarkii]ARU91535.1 hypothetical protein SCLARK_00927 [Spiroplasma clarkii]ATX70941.1 hypothetical protein SCLAR_v1c06220 [Spiroplasma clarkii]
MKTKFFKKIHSFSQINLLIYCYAGVQGFRATWQYTSINANVSGWTILEKEVNQNH